MAPAEKPIGGNRPSTSYRRKPGTRRRPGESREPVNHWTPAFAGVTTYYESVNDGMKTDELRKTARLGKGKPKPAMFRPAEIKHQFQAALKEKSS